MQPYHQAYFSPYMPPIANAPTPRPDSPCQQMGNYFFTTQNLHMLHQILYYTIMAMRTSYTCHSQPLLQAYLTPPIWVKIKILEQAEISRKPSTVGKPSNTPPNTHPPIFDPPPPPPTPCVGSFQFHFNSFQFHFSSFQFISVHLGFPK